MAGSQPVPMLTTPVSALLNREHFFWGFIQSGLEDPQGQCLHSPSEQPSSLLVYLLSVALRAW